MNIRLSFSSMLINTPFEQDETLLLDSIGRYIQQMKNIEKLKDWTMVLCINYTSVKNHGPFIWIFKRNRTYKNDKEKEFTIHIPLPSIEDRSWGIRSSQITSQQPFKEAYFYKIDARPTSYDSLYDYVNQLIIKGVDELFSRGFSFNGIKIKKEQDNVIFRSKEEKKSD